MHINHKHILFFLLFLIFAIFYLLRGGTYTNLSDVKYLFLLFVYFIVPPLMYKYYINFCSRVMIAVSVSVFWVIVIYTLYRTYPVSTDNPYIIRMAASNEQLNSSLTALGVMNYGLPHALSFIVPGLVVGFKMLKSKYMRLICLLFIAIVFIMIYFSGSTTAMILSIGGLMLSFFFSGKETNSGLLIKVLAVVLFLFIVSETNLLGTLFNLSQGITADTAFQEKIDDFESASGDTQFTGRSSLFMKSFDVFLHNPFWGSVDGEVGGHNYFIDMLASVGIVGFIPLCIYIYLIIKDIYFSLSKKTRFYYLVGAILFIMMGFMKNIWGMESFLMAFFLLPVSIHLIAAYNTNH